MASEIFTIERFSPKHKNFEKFHPMKSILKLKIMAQLKSKVTYYTLLQCNIARHFPFVLSVPLSALSHFPTLSRFYETTVDERVCQTRREQRSREGPKEQVKNITCRPRLLHFREEKNQSN